MFRASNSRLRPHVDAGFRAGGIRAIIGRQQAHGDRMTDGFTAKPLALNKINQAYPLVRAARPDLTADGWRAVAAEYLAARQDAPETPCGVVAVQNEQGYIVGLFCYAACDDMRHGVALQVENLTAIDLFNQAGVMETLLREVEKVARRLRCRAVLAARPTCSRPDSQSGRLVSACFWDAGDGRDGLLRLLDDAPDHASDGA